MITDHSNSTQTEYHHDTAVAKVAWVRFQLQTSSFRLFSPYPLSTGREKIEPFMFSRPENNKRLGIKKTNNSKTSKISKELHYVSQLNKMYIKYK